MKNKKKVSGVPTAINNSEKINNLEIKTLTDNIPGMIYHGYPDWSAKFFKGSIKLCGYSHEELNSKKLNWLKIIHPKDRDRVIKESTAFERFYQGSSSAPGTGIGLSISKKIINDLKGKIWLESKGKYKGTTAFVELEKK
ncbi:PAS domain-containing sensor histidine kinase [Candidatus Poribacteria bacterium]|nr:PAS domain-containing sensor histidine kinase [Candidatus Poribacteria bacterium]